MDYSQFNTLNLLVPAFGNTSALRYDMPVKGQYYIDWKSVQANDILFIPQSMTIDLRDYPNTENVEIVFGPTGYSITVLGGRMRTFNFPSAENLITTFVPTSGITNFSAYFYNWPAFPDSESVAASSVVSISGIVSVALASPNPLQVIPSPRSAAINGVSNNNVTASAAGSSALLKTFSTAGYLYNTRLSLQPSSYYTGGGQFIAQIELTDGASGNTEILSKLEAYLPTAFSGPAYPLTMNGFHEARFNESQLFVAANSTLNLVIYGPGNITGGGFDVFWNADE